MRKLITGIVAAAMFCAAFAMTAFAGTWHQDGHGWWYEDNGSYYANGMQYIEGSYYIFDADGYMMTGWGQTKGGDWYYAHPSGVVAMSEWVGDYYFEDDGRMAKSKWIDGKYYVGSDGKWDKSKKPEGGSDGIIHGLPYWLPGEYRNVGANLYKYPDKYITLQIYGDSFDTDNVMNGYFALVDQYGPLNGIYDKVNPSGDNFEISNVGYGNYEVTSTITGKEYSLKFDGDNQVTLYWRGTGWTSGTLTLYKVKDYNEDLYYYHRSNSVG